MANRATQPKRGARAFRRAAATIAAGCCALGLGALPTAQAAKSVPTASNTTAAGEATAAPHDRRAERAAQAERAVPAPVLPPPPAVPTEAPGQGHGKHVRAISPPPGSQPLPAVGSGAPTPRKLDREAPAVRARRHEEGATTSTQGNQAAGVSGEEAKNVEALARKAKKEKGKEKKKEKVKETNKEKKEKKEKGEKTTTPPPPVVTSDPGKSKGKTVAGTSPEPSPAGQPTAQAAAFVTPAPTPVGGTGSASIASAAPSLVTGVRAQRSASGTRRRRAPRAAGGVPAVVSALPAAPLVPARAAAPKPSAPLHAAVKRAPESATQPALVKTITRIVGVVPTPVLVLIAALVALALALAVRSRLSGVRTRRLVRQRGQLLEDVGLLQAALLPVPPARLGPVGTSVAYRPADGPGAGGDFYDVFGLDDGRLAVIVGDVSGHGREALPHTALVRFTVRAYLEAGLSPRMALQTAGSVLERQLAGSFATVVAAVYHPRERTLTYSSAGHPPPVVLGRAADAGPDGEPAGAAIALTTACSAPPIGAGMRTGTRETTIAVPGAARLCFHTDGVTEARVGEDLFGSERLAVALADLGRDATAPALLDSIVARTDARPDDMAACLLRVEGGAEAPRIADELLELDGATIASGRAERFLLASGVTAADAANVLDAARTELDRRDSALLALSFADGRPVASLQRDNVVRTAALTAVGS